MNVFLIIGAALSALAALLHLGCIVFGASWYRFFGAGEQMAVWAEQGNLIPTLITSGISLMLVTWSIYAISAAGAIGRLPFLRPIIIAITAVYLIRGIGGFFLIVSPGENSAEFILWSSAICCVYGGVHLIGVWQRRREI